MERGTNDVHNGPADATATASSPASLKFRMVQLFWCWLTQVVLEKRPLNLYIKLVNSVESGIA